jgi:hypothetical protein
VVATVNDTAQGATDVDSYYSMRSAFSSSSNTVCLDIDWVVGGCMSVDPVNVKDPVRVDCNDMSVPTGGVPPTSSRASRMSISASGLGYAYDERRFTVCVENVRITAGEIRISSSAV